MFTRSVAVVIARPLDGKGSSVHFSVTGRPAGLLRLMQPVIARSTQRNLDEGFARLKGVLEGGQ